MNSRQRKALRSVREETDYEDDRVGGTDNYVLLGVLGSGIGQGTIGHLLSLGLIEAGPNRFCNETGYRITTAGRDALNEPQKPTPTPRRRNLKPMPSRIGEPKSRFI